jgi:hypothetical protein
VHPSEDWDQEQGGYCGDDDDLHYIGNDIDGVALLSRRVFLKFKIRNKHSSASRSTVYCEHTSNGP